MATKKNPLDEKFKQDELLLERLTNDQLTCRDCKLRYNDDELPCNTSKCEMFQVKPDKVLSGGECDEKVTE